MLVKHCQAIFAVLSIVVNLIFACIFTKEYIPFQIIVALSTTFGVYVLLPVLFYFSPSIQRFLIFQHKVRRPTHVNFSDPQTEGVEGARNIYLKLDDDTVIGVWHILPISLITIIGGNQDAEIIHDVWDETLRASGKPIIVYMHGNTGSRALGHRKELYQVLQSIDCHVICCDYRGYADSSPMSPSETLVVHDGIFVYKWVREIVGNSNPHVQIFVWGHSLGSGISSHIVARLCLEGDEPKGLILESPFTSLGESIRHHYIAAPYTILPAFDQIFLEPLKRNDIVFESYRHIANINIPIAILHCEDDQIVPYLLGRKLFEIGRIVRSEKAKPIIFKGFTKGYAHKFICRAPELPSFIESFLDCCVRDEWDTAGLQE